MDYLIDQFNLFPFIVFYLLAFLCAMSLSPVSRGKTAMLVFWALVLRFLTSRLLPYAIVADDEYGYYLMGESYAAALSQGSTSAGVENTYGNLTGLIFYFFGSSIYTMRPFNTLLSVISACLLARLALQQFRDQVMANKVLALMLLAPPLIFISSVALKEQLIAFLLILVLYGYLRRVSTAVLLYPLGIVGLAIFRRDLALVVLPLTLLHFVFRLVFASALGAFSKALIFAGSVVMFALFVAFSLGSEQVLSSKSATILRGVDERGRETLMSSDATYARYLDVTDPGALSNLVLVPLQQTYFPSPLRPLKTPAPEVYVESLFITSIVYFFMPYFILGMLYSWPDTERLLPVALYLVVFLTSAFSILTFAPESLRYRLPGMPIFLYVALLGMLYQRRFRVAVLRLWWLSAVAASAVYLAV